MTQAIQILLNFPSTAASVPAAACAALEDLHEDELGGIGTLRELLAELRARPGRSSSQLLEGWRERPEYRRLGELQAERLLLDDTRAAAELTGILERIATQVALERKAQRYDELLAKLESHSATPEESLEFQSLSKRPTLRPG